MNHWLALLKSSRQSDAELADAKERAARRRRREKQKANEKLRETLKKKRVRLMSRGDERKLTKSQIDHRYYVKNKARIAAVKRAWRERNQDKANALWRAYYWRHHERVLARKKRLMRRYRKNRNEVNHDRTFARRDCRPYYRAGIEATGGLADART